MRAGAFILLCSLVFVQCRQSLVEMDYALNKDYIKRVLCIEKDIPSSTCNGKCQLKKELAKVEAPAASHERQPLKVSIEEIHYLSYTIDIFQEHMGTWRSNDYAPSLVLPLHRGFHLISYPPPEFS